MKYAPPVGLDCALDGWQALGERDREMHRQVGETMIPWCCDPRFKTAFDARLALPAAEAVRGAR